MKVLAKILTLYIIGLAIYPCVDSMHKHFTQEDQVCDVQQHNQHSEDHEDEKPHSPLCSCKCHHHHTTVKASLQLAVIDRFSTQLPLQNTQSLLDYNPSLFHVPIS